MISHKKYYFPLTVTSIERDDYGYIDMNDEGYECDGDYVNSHAGAIRAKFNSYTADDEDMATYIHDPELKAKVESMKWGFEEIGNTLWGVVDVTLNGEISEEDEEAIKDYIIGQNADGLGEGFEQQEIPVSDGIIYVHFWSFAYDYRVYNDEEFADHIESQGMGAM